MIIPDPVLFLQVHRPEMFQNKQNQEVSIVHRNPNNFGVLMSQVKPLLRNIEIMYFFNNELRWLWKL